MTPYSDMVAALEEHKNLNGHTKKVYKVQSDEHKGELLQADIDNRISALKDFCNRGKIDFGDFEQVKRRTFEYLEACKEACVYPSVMGLSVHGFGISRQRLSKFLKDKPNSQVAEFIECVKDLMADVLTNAALYRNADATSVIFQLKNHFGHSDRLEIEPVQKIAPLGEEPDRAELEARIAAVVVEE